QGPDYYLCPPFTPQFSSNPSSARLDLMGAENLLFCASSRAASVKISVQQSSIGGGCIGGSWHFNDSSGRASIQEECHHVRRFLMLSLYRFAGIIAVLAVCGTARSQELAPPGSGVSVHKMVIQNTVYHTVRYTVTGGSPRLQALVRRVEWTENEL